jgi:hypothetical protein
LHRGVGLASPPPASLPNRWRHCEKSCDRAPPHSIALDVSSRLHHVSTPVRIAIPVRQEPIRNASSAKPPVFNTLPILDSIDRSWQTTSPACVAHFCTRENCWIAAGQTRSRPFLHHYSQAKPRRHRAKQERPIFSGRCAKSSHETDDSTLFALPAVHDSPTALYERGQRMAPIIPRPAQSLAYATLEPLFVCPELQHAFVCDTPRRPTITAVCSSPILKKGGLEPHDLYRIYCDRCTMLTELPGVTGGRLRSRG